MLGLACAHSSRIERKALDDGSYLVVCKEPLTRCQTAIEEVCHDGYEIVRAHEDRAYAGPREYSEPAITSEVVGRCRSAAPLFGGVDRAPQQPAAAAANESGGPGPAAAPRSCFPGATQACFGPGACRGGQQCLADGAAFGPCDCGATGRRRPRPLPPHRTRWGRGSREMKPGKLADA